MRIGKDKHYVSIVQRYILNILLRTYHLSKHCIMDCGKKGRERKGKEGLQIGRKKASKWARRKKERREQRGGGRKGGKEGGRKRDSAKIRRKSR